MTEDTYKRNVALAIAIDALDLHTGTSVGLSPTQMKILRVLRKERDLNQSWASWEMEWPNLCTVILPVLKQRGLIVETVEHEPPPDLRWDKQPRKLVPINHRDIAITDVGLVVLHRYEMRIKRSASVWKR